MPVSHVRDAIADATSSEVRHSLSTNCGRRGRSRMPRILFRREALPFPFSHLSTDNRSATSTDQLYCYWSVIYEQGGIDSLEVERETLPIGVHSFPSCLHDLRRVCRRGRWRSTRCCSSDWSTCASSWCSRLAIVCRSQQCTNPSNHKYTLYL